MNGLTKWLMGLFGVAFVALTTAVLADHNSIVAIKASRFTAADYAVHLKESRLSETVVADKFNTILLSIETLRRQIGADEVEALKERIEELEKKLERRMAVSNGDGLMFKVGVGVIGGLLVAAIVGLVALSREVTSNAVTAEKNCETIMVIREDLGRRLDRFEARQDQILQALRKPD
jgi:hypothetical protein